eukprot:scaffold54013_cov72-Phaeocystis_antarctica.AAC.3
MVTSPPGRRRDRPERHVRARRRACLARAPASRPPADAAHSFSHTRCRPHTGSHHTITPRAGLAPRPACDTGNHRIRRVELANGATTTLAGSTAGNIDDVGTDARFNSPRGVAIAPSGTYALVSVRASPAHARLARFPPTAHRAVPPLPHRAPA